MVFDMFGGVELVIQALLLYRNGPFGELTIYTCGAAQALAGP